MSGFFTLYFNGLVDYCFSNAGMSGSATLDITGPNGFTETIKLNVGGKFATATFLGEGHTKDNVVGYFPSENVLFGGCLIKEMQATKGFLGDANVKEWSATVRHVKQAFPSVKLVIPGHGQIGGQELLDYTINLFKHE